MKPQLKSLLFALGFYVLYFIAAVIGGEIDPGGPCVPGLGAAMVFMLVPIGIIGFLASVILYYSGSKNLKWCIWLHLSIPAIFMLALSFL